MSITENPEMTFKLRATRGDLAGICLIALLIGMFISNVNAAQKGVTLRGKPPTPLWLRAPMQIFFASLLWWATRR
jgi:uncharacterized membrane protein